MKTITLSLSDADYAALEHIIVDVNAHFNELASSMINRAKSRIVADGYKLLEADQSVTSVPKDRDALISVIKARGDYKDAKAREEARGE